MAISTWALNSDRRRIFRMRASPAVDRLVPGRHVERGEQMKSDLHIVTAARPDFICIGAQKCATTWLQNVLADHPDIALRKGDDLDFFSYRYERGMQWYLRNLPAATVDVRIGEISRSYFHEPVVPARVIGHLPDVKLLLCLRDPVERAISNHRHEVRVGHLAGDDLSFEAGLANNPMYILQGRYATHLSRWYAHFPRTQILVVLYDEIVATPGEVVERVYRFVGVDAAHRPDALERKSNASYVSRYPGVERLRRRLRYAVASTGFNPLWRAGQRLGMQRLYRGLNRQAPEAIIPPVSDATRQRLYSLFRREVEELEQLLERSLPEWY